MTAFAGTLAAVMAVSFALAALTYRFIEYPGISAGNRLIAYLSGPAGGARRYPAAM